MVDDALAGLPPPDQRGRLLRTRVARDRRRLVRRAFAFPAMLLLLGLILFIFLGITQPDAGAAVPDLLEGLRERLPGPLGRLTPLQFVLLPFLGIGAYEVARGARFARCTWEAQLTVTEDGRLEQRDAEVEHVDLGYLTEVDVEPSSAFEELNERSPIGSPLLLRLTDASGTTVCVNPGLWHEEEALLEVIDRFVRAGHATVSPAAAESYGLPLRGRHGEEGPDPSAQELPPEVIPVGQGTSPSSEAEVEAALRERGIEIQRGPQVEPGGLDDEE
jgi:hypothetical protein